MTSARRVLADADAAAEACASQILAQIEMAQAGRGDVTLAMSGGSTPKLMFAHLVRAQLDWSRVHIFCVDERAVPPDHDDSNFRMMQEHLIQPARISLRNVHRIQSELSPAHAARHYEREIRDFFHLEGSDLPHFDIVHLGIGSDAHTASLFPGEPLIEDRQGLVAAVKVEKLGKWRITLLPGAILSARHAVVLAAGEDKAGALARVFSAPYAPLELPAQLIVHDSRRATWFLDAAAAAQLD